MTGDRFRALRPEEMRDIGRLFGVEPEDNDLLAMGAGRNACRLGSALGLLIVAALSEQGGTAREVFEMATSGSGWTPEDVDEFLEEEN